MKHLKVETKRSREEKRSLPKGKYIGEVTDVTVRVNRPSGTHPEGSSLLVIEFRTLKWRRKLFTCIQLNTLTYNSAYLTWCQLKSIGVRVSKAFDERTGEVSFNPIQLRRRLLGKKFQLHVRTATRDVGTNQQMVYNTVNIGEAMK
jgi:hypothetical protein